MNETNKDPIEAIWDYFENQILRMPEDQLNELAKELGIDVEKSTENVEKLIRELEAKRRDRK